MFHQPDAGVVGEEISQQALDKPRCAGERFPGQDDGGFERHKAPERREAAPWVERRGDDRVNYQLADPERGDRREGEQQPQRDHNHSVAAARLPDQFNERRRVTKRRNSLAPGSWLTLRGVSSHTSYHT